MTRDVMGTQQLALRARVTAALAELAAVQADALTLADATHDLGYASDLGYTTKEETPCTRP